MLDWKKDFLEEKALESVSSLLLPLVVVVVVIVVVVDVVGGSCGCG